MKEYVLPEGRQDDPVAVCEDSGWVGQYWELLTDPNDDYGHRCPTCDSKNVEVLWNE